MEDTAREIEIESHVSIDMENNSITNQRIQKEDHDDVDDLILKNSPLFASIKAMLETLSPQSTECCIYRVHGRLRKVNEEAYTPRLISIGPFHHGEERFQDMEEYKLRHLKAFLLRTGPCLAYYLKTVQMWEQRARDYYSETIPLSSDEFVKMILVDGSFIVEFLLRLSEGDTFYKPWMDEFVFSDMILLENQLPFFVLDDFFNSVVPKEKPPLLELVHECCCSISRLPDKISTPEIKHLVDYIHHVYVSSIPELQQVPSKTKKSHFVDFLRRCYLRLSFQKVEQKQTGKYERSPTVTQLHQAGIPELRHVLSKSKKSHFVDFLRRCYLRLSFQKVEQKQIRKYERSPTVTQLHQAGIKFKKGTSISLFDIKFSNNGILEIPQLNINDLTGSWFQNLIAFEQCHRVDKCIFSDYFDLLDGMIDTSKDVDLLIHSEIITNMLSSSGEVSTLFNNICKEVAVDPNDFYFSNLCQELNAYCKSPRHKWIATLRRDYFSTPWAVISVIAAVVLIVLTFIQAICSIISL